MKKRHGIAALAIVALVALGGLTWRWTFTPYGRLDWRAALSLHLLTFEYTYKPEPSSDFQLTLPINLLYPLSMLLPAENVRKLEDVIIPAGDREIAARVYWPDSVEYRLAPAHPYPAAVEDAYAAFAWVAGNAAQLEADPRKLFVGGDSAGGNLAAVVALRARDAGGPAIAGQLLYYPVTDPFGADYDSVRNFSDGYGLSREGGSAFRRAYAGHVQDQRDPYLSPLRARSLAGLPPALVVTAGFDPLTDSAKAYVARLRDAGVPVTDARYPDVFHGFMSIRFFPQRRDALTRTAGFVSEHSRD